MNNLLVDLASNDVFAAVANTTISADAAAPTCESTIHTAILLAIAVAT